MKSIYAILINGKVSAFHKKWKVVKKYAGNYRQTNPRDNVTICEMRKEVWKDHPLRDDYYLTPFHKTYVQKKYLWIMELEDRCSEKEGLIFQVDELLRNTKNESDACVLLKVQDVIKENLNRQRHYTPSISILDEISYNYEEYRRKMEGW